MKTLNQQSHLVLVALASVTLLSSCNKMEFAKVAESSVAKTDIPMDPIPVTPPVVTPVTPPVVPVIPQKTFKLSDGACAQDSSTQILSCLKCEVPQIVQKPQLSVKAQALLDIMTLSCGVSNKSDQNNFRPTREMILNKLNQASELNYPDSKRTAGMEMVVQGLTNPNDGSLRQKMFGGLWYQPPYSDSFETYFGLTTSEAKSTFCWYGDTKNGIITDPVGVYSIEWIQCQSSGNSFACPEKPIYNTAQIYRTQLKNSLQLGVRNPYSAPTPDPQKKCHWDKFEGDDLIAAKQMLKQWTSQGRKVSMTAKKNSVGLCSDAAENNITEGSTIEMATYKCD